MHIYWIRHGQSLENTHPWDGRNENSPLSPLGEAQVAALAAWLSDEAPFRFERLYTSNMRRALQTSAAITAALGLAAITDDRLREVGNNFPDGSPCPDDQLPRMHATVWGSREPYHPISQSGETWMHFRNRVGHFVEWLLTTAPAEHKHYRVGVVCHGGVIEGVFEHVFHKSPRSEVLVQTSNTGISHMEYWPLAGKPDWTLHYHNQTRHLRLDQIS
jgi:probable phosphoglycerate mutase